MCKYKKTIVILTMLIIICSPVICTYAQDLSGLQEQSTQITLELNETNNRLQAVQEQLSTNMQQLQDLDNQIAQSQEDLNTINTDINTLITQIQENEEKLVKIQKEYDDMQEILDTRLIQMYEAPKLEFLEVILGAKNVSEFLSRYYAMKELAECDAELLGTAKKQKDDIETTKQILTDKKKQVVTSKQNIAKKTQVLSNTKTMREYYISKLSTEEQKLQAEIDVYNTQVAEIEAEIKFLALNSISEDYIGGAMIWPVPGYTRITSQYGMRVHPITGAFKLHTGVDIGAPLGAEFVSAANGIVSKATFNTAYGNMVIVDHGGGVQTLYAHGDEILVQVGQEISIGTPVLKVGSTGYSTGPHAHFEIRIDGQTINPLDYLLKQNENKEETDTSETNTENN